MIKAINYIKLKIYLMPLSYSKTKYMIYDNHIRLFNLTLIMNKLISSRWAILKFIAGAATLHLGLTFGIKVKVNKLSFTNKMNQEDE